MYKLCMKLIDCFTCFERTKESITIAASETVTETTVTVEYNTDTNNQRRMAPLIIINFVLPFHTVYIEISHSTKIFGNFQQL